MKVHFFITFLVLAVVKLATARFLLEGIESEDNKNSFSANSNEGDSEQKTAESATLEVEPVETTTLVNFNIEKVAKLLSEDLDKLEVDDNSAINETEIIEVIVKRQGKEEKETKSNSENDQEEISLDNNEDNDDIQETEENRSKEKQFHQDSVQTVDRNVPSEEQDIEEVVFAIEPIGAKTSHKSDFSSASDEETSKVGTNRNARPDILIERRLMLNHELMQKKLAAAQALDALAKMGSSRNYAGDLSSHTAKLYNGQLYHQPFPYNPTSPHDNPALFYQDNIQHIANSQERAGFTVNLESNSYPYTPSANTPERRVVNTIVHLPYQGYHNFLDHNYSPLKNPIVVGGNGRLKRNAVIVDSPRARYPIPQASILF